MTALALVPAVHGAPAAGLSQARQLGTGCEPNGLPNSLALCDGTGRLNVQLEGTAVMSVMKGDVTLKGQPTRVCKNKRLRRKNGARVVRRVCSKRPKSILPDVETREARGYTIFKGERLFFYLPPGNWRISARGEGLSLSAVGEGRAGVQAAPQGEAPEFLATESTGLISVGGELYDEWPLRWTLFEFGPDLGTDEEEPPAREVDQKTRTTISGSRIGLDRPMAEPPPSDSEQPAKEDKNGTTVAESARTLYSFGAEVPTVHG